MKLLTYTNLDKEVYSNLYEIQGKIALFSLYIEFGKELITLNEEAVVLYRNK